MLVIYSFPFTGSPSGKVNAIGNITYMEFLREIARPNGGKHLLRYFTMEIRNTVSFLTGIECENGHRELLAAVVGVLTTHTDELIPVNAKALWIF